MSVPFAVGAGLAELPGIVHGFFGREGGRSAGRFASLNAGEATGDDPRLVAANRAATAETLGLEPASLATLAQVHSARVLTLDRAPAPGSRPEADGMVTALSDLALGIVTADCAPILLADPEAGVIGAAHAGWKGAVAGIVGNTVAAMAALGARPDRIVAAIGPTISFENYEVGPDFAAALLDRHPGAANRIGAPGGGREHFDLPGFVADRLREAGIGAIGDTGLCTYADPGRWFSHRRATHQGSSTGRQIAIICRR